MNYLFLISVALFPWHIGSLDQNEGTLNGYWKLVCFENHKTNERSYRPLNDPLALTFIFKDDGQRGKIEGRTTTNKVSGDYIINRNRIYVENFGGTKIAEQGWGNNFWATIKKASSYKFKNDTLIIQYDYNSKAMLFVPANEKID